MSDHRLNLINDPLRSETKDMCSKILCNRYAGKSVGFCWLFLIFHAVFARNCSPASSGRGPGVRGQRSGCAVTRIMQVGKVGRAGSNSPESCKLGRWAERQVWALSQVEPSDAPALPSSLLNKFHRSEKAISHITLLSVLPTLPTFPTCMISGELDWGGAGAALYLTLHC